MSPTLRPYQAASLEAVCDALEAGHTRVLVQKPTGTGKTVTFAALPTWPRLETWLASLPPGKGAIMLVIAHREELLDQAADKILKQHPGWIVSVEQGDRRAHRFSNVVVASIQTLAAMKYRRLEKLLRDHTFRIVIIDEAHHAAAPTYRNVLVRMGFLPPADATDSEGVEAANYDDLDTMKEALAGWDDVGPKDRLLVGVTATPNRTDAIGLGCVFQTMAYSYRLRQAIQDQWLVPISPYVVETQQSLDDVRITAGEFNQKDLAEAVNTNRRNRIALDAWKQYAEGRSTIAFTVDVAHAHAVAELFDKAGIPARAVSGTTHKDDRREILRQFQAGQIQVVANCMVLTEGTDLPRTSCILHLKPTKSATLYEQMSGRGLRLFPGKEDCVFIDLVDVARKHSLMQAPVLYGLPPGLKANGKDLGTIADDMDEFRNRHPSFNIEGTLAQRPYTVAELEALVKTINVWDIAPIGPEGAGLTLQWLKVTESTFRLQYPWNEGVEVLLVAPDLLGKFIVSATYREKAPDTGAAYPHARRYANGQPPPPDIVRQKTIGEGYESAAMALQAAETFVKTQRQAASRLTDQEASWRKRPASSGQFNLLRRLRVPHDPQELASPGGMGKASQLIDMAMARKGR